MRRAEYQGYLSAGIRQSRRKRNVPCVPGADKSVPDVAGELIAANTPDQSSPEDTERMFLVYGDEYYHLQDPQKPTDTLIEIDSKEYVQRNYDSSFLQGYLTAVLIGNLFDSMGGGVTGVYK